MCHASRAFPNGFSYDGSVTHQCVGHVRSNFKKK
jgi:hypothetical protein